MELLFFLSDSLLLVYRNTTDFCILIFVSCSFNSFIISFSSFWWRLQGFPYIIMSFANSESLLLPFQLVCFIYFSYLISLARTSNTVSNKSGKNEHLCLVPDLRREAFSFSPLSMMTVVGLSSLTFIILRYVTFVPTLFCLKEMLNFMRFCVCACMQIYINTFLS